MVDRESESWFARLKGAKVLRCLSGVAALAFSIGAVPAVAQTYPDRPIRFIIPFTAGGGTDITARLVAEYLAPRLGQPIVPENRAGASAAIGADLVTKSAPNGYTLLVGTATLAGSAAVSGSALPFDLVNDFEFIGKLAQLDLVIVTSSKTKADDLRGLVNLMRTQPDKVQFGSPGNGSPAHLGGELLKQLTKTDALHIPYKGESAAMADLISGRISFQLCSVFVCAPRIQDGSLKGLAVAAKKRSRLAPNIPTTAEAGFPGVEADTWYFLAAPKGTPAAIVNKLNQALNEALGDPQLKSRLEAAGLEAEPGTTPASVKAALQAEIDKWRPVVKAAGITIN